MFCPLLIGAGNGSCWGFGAWPCWLSRMRPGIVVAEPALRFTNREGRGAGMTQRLCSAILLTLAAMAAVGCTHVTDRYQASAPVEASPG